MIILMFDEVIVLRSITAWDYDGARRLLKMPSFEVLGEWNGSGRDVFWYGEFLVW